MSNSAIQASIHTPSLFDWTTEVQETHVLLDEFGSLLKKADQLALKIGQKLLKFQENCPHGEFMTFLDNEFGLSRMTAYRFIGLAIAGKEEPDKFLRMVNFPLYLQYELAGASFNVVESVQSGAIPATIKAVQEAKRREKEALDVAKRAEEKKIEAILAESKSRADALATQQQLLLFQTSAEAEISALSQQIADLLKEKEAQQSPQVEIREVYKEVLPESVKNDLESLRKKIAAHNETKEAELKALQDSYQAQINKLTEDLAVEKKAVPLDFQKKADELQKKFEKVGKERTQLQEENKSQKERLSHLDAQLKVAIQNRIASEADERIRQGWRSLCSESYSCLMRLLGGWPTPLDAQSFEADDWDRLSQLRTTLLRVVEECDNLRYKGDDMIVEQHQYIEAFSH